MRTRFRAATPLVVAVLAMLAAATLVACGRGGRDRHAHHYIVVLGDSLTVGVGASDANNGFVYVLYRKILADDPSAQIINFGIRGARISEVMQDQFARAPAGGVTDAWICVGANDVLSGESLDEIAAAQDALAATARARWPGAHLVLFGVLDVARAPIVPGEAKFLMHRRAADANDAVRNAADHAHAEFVDLFAFSDRRLDSAQDVSEDGFHPNDRGYALLADYAENAVFDR